MYAKYSPQQKPFEPTLLFFIASQNRIVKYRLCVLNVCNCLDKVKWSISIAARTQRHRSSTQPLPVFCFTSLRNRSNLRNHNTVLITNVFPLRKKVTNGKNNLAIFSWLFLIFKMIAFSGCESKWSEMYTAATAKTKKNYINYKKST